MLRLFSLLALFSALAWSTGAQALKTHERMQNVVKRVALKTGAPIGVTGSWVTGKNFHDPLIQGGTSDFDMTLRTTGLPDDQAARQWNQIKEQLAREIRAEFGNQADTILKKTNLYPPAQLMPADQVKDLNSAAARYKKLGQVPSLDPFYEKARQRGVDLSTWNLKAAAEGFYGEGGRKFVQAYEYKSGATYVRLPGSQEVVSCANPNAFSKAWVTTLSPQGRSGFITQLNLKTLDLLDQGDQRAAVKNLKRCLEERKEFQKNLDIDRGEDPFLKQLNPDNPLSASDQKLLRDKILKIELENQFMLRQSPGRAGQLVDKLWDKMNKVAGAGMWTLDKVGAFAQGFFTTLEVAQLAGAVSRQDYEQAIKSTGLGIMATGAASPVFLAEMVSLTMDMSKELGYGLIDKNIDVLDFLSGVRRDDVGDDTTLHDARELLRRWTGEEVFRAFVNHRAMQAWPADTSIDRANRERWLEKSLAYYRATRGALEKRYHQMAEMAEDQGYYLLLPRAQPTSHPYWMEVRSTGGPIQQPVEVRGIRLAPEEIARELKEMAHFHPARLAPEKAGSVPRLTYQWFLDGQKVAESQEPRYTFGNLAPGNHTLEVQLETFYNPIDPVMVVYSKAAASQGLKVVSSATLKVSVRDRETDQVLAGANVEADGGKLSTTSDGSGLATLQLPSSNGDSVLVGVSCPGYKPRQGTVKIRQGLARAAAALDPILKVTISGPTRPLTGPKSDYRVVVAGGTPPYRYQWYLDGTVQDARKDQVEVSWLEVGGHILACDISDAQGITRSKSLSVEVEAGKLKTELLGPERVSTSDKSEYRLKLEGGVAPFRMEWFVDGERTQVSEDSMSVIMTWAKITPGKHTFRVLVSDKTGVTSEAQKTVELETFQANASGPNQVVQGQQSTYQVKVSGGKAPYVYQWYLDGVLQSVSSEAMTVTWKNPGSCKLSIVVTDASGARDQIADTIQIRPVGPTVAAQPPVEGAYTPSVGTYSGQIERRLNDKSLKPHPGLTLTYNGKEVGGVMRCGRDQGMLIDWRFKGEWRNYTKKGESSQRKIGGEITGTVNGVHPVKGGFIVNQISGNQWSGGWYVDFQNGEHWSGRFQVAR